jgi:hypothetical protein
LIGSTARLVSKRSDDEHAVQYDPAYVQARVQLADVLARSGHDAAKING